MIIATKHPIQSIRCLYGFAFADELSKADRLVESVCDIYHHIQNEIVVWNIEVTYDTQIRIVKR